MGVPEDATAAAAISANSGSLAEGNAGLVSGLPLPRGAGLGRVLGGSGVVTLRTWRIVHPLVKRRNVLASMHRAS
jgi:hypothetical protein